MDKKTRFFSACFAVLMSFSLWLPYLYPSHPITKSANLNQAFTLWLPSPSAPSTPSTPLATQSSVRKMAQVSEKKFISIQTPKYDNPALSSQTPAATISPNPTIETPPSPSLDLVGTIRTMDKKEMLHIYNAGKSDIQQLAEASGKKLNTSFKTRYERFQNELEYATLPDCLTPQQEKKGSGLLALPMIIAATATGKCK